MILKRWQHALLSLVILLGLIALITAVCIQPTFSYFKDRQTELTTQQERLQRYQQVASQKDTLIPFYKKQISKTSDQKYFLPMMAPSLAAAKLQEQVKSLMETHQGQLVSTQAVQARTEGVFVPVMIRVHIKSDIKSLTNVLHQLESSRPLAFIENLQIQRVGASGKKRRKKPKITPKPLDTRFDVKVYMLNDKAEI